MLRGTGLESDIRWNNQGQVSTLYPLCAEEWVNKQNGCLLVTEKGTDLAMGRKQDPSKDSDEILTLLNIYWLGDEDSNLS